MKHGCIDCTHQKQYRSDLLDEGAILEDSVDGVAIEGVGNELAEVWHPFLNLIVINSEFYPRMCRKELMQICRRTFYNNQCNKKHHLKEYLVGMFA
jgi:hypothetical protein